MLKVILSILAAIIVLIIGGLTWAYFAFVHTKALTTAELADLTPDWSLVTGGNWSPWYTQADGTTIWSPTKSFNAWLETVPEEDKAWPVLIEASYAFDALVDNDLLGALPLDDMHREPMRLRHRQLLTQIIDTEQGDALYALLNETLRRPVLGCMLSPTLDPDSRRAMLAHGVEVDPVPDSPEDDQFFNAQIPEHHLLHRYARFIVLKAMLSIHDDDTKGFIEAVDLLVASSALLEEFPINVRQLSGAMIRGRAMDLIMWALAYETDMFTERDLDALIAINERCRDKSPHTTVTGEMESMAIHDVLRRVASADGTLDELDAWPYIASLRNDRFDPRPACSLAIADLDPIFQEPMLYLDEALDNMVNACAIPWDESTYRDVDETFEGLDRYHKYIELVMGMLWPATDAFAQKMRQYNQQGEGVYLALLLYQYQAAHGHFPETLELIELDTAHGHPVDSFSDEPLRYRLVDTDLGPEPLIYSVGTDRDDDEGWPMRTYDISDLTQAVAVHSKLEEDYPPPAKSPHWITQSRVDEINAKDPGLINGDWVLYPEPEEPEEPEDD